MIIKIEELIRESENPKLEFKENIKPIDKILATIIAFANGGGGKLIIGVTDKERYIVGVADPHEISEVLANKIYDTIEPKILPNIEIIPYRNTYVIVVEIFPSPIKPHFIQSSKTGKKETYIRIASTTRTADAALINVIERSKFPKHYDEELCFEAKCEELNFTLLSQLIEHKRKLQDSDLITLGLLAQNGKNLIPTVGGVILFGKEHLKYFPHAFIKLGVFAGINKEKILNDQKVESFLPNAIEEVLNFVRKNIDVEIRVEDIQNQEIWEIPKIALREIIINAIVHTDYSLSGSPITIAIFKDRIEIENNALLPWGLSFEELKSGISKLRNPVIARIFKEIGLIEQWGSGLTRAISACQDAGLKSPQFEEIGARIRVTFYKEKIKEPMVTVHTNQLIIELVSICGLLSTNKLANYIGKSRRSIISILNNLKDAGQIIEVSKSINDPKKKYTTKTGKKIRENT